MMPTRHSLSVDSTAGIIKVHIDDLKVGVNDTGNHFVKLNANREIVYIIDKVCDHAGGRLILAKGGAVCPMHGWKLDLDTLNYDASHSSKSQTEYRLRDDGTIEISDPTRTLKNPLQREKRGTFIVRWINHASVYFECNGRSVVTDPWFFGPAFTTGWWLESTSPGDAVEVLRGADFVFLSHNHPDHLHAETLSVLPKDQPFLVPAFASRSVEKYLGAMGFTNVTALGFGELFEVAEDFQVSILKSGDFRDDSGLYVHGNGHQALLTVDANFLNSHVLPSEIDILMTAFASGASGFPLCYDNYSEAEKAKIMKRNRNSARFSVHQYIQKTNARYYMPYAGMFRAHATRDSYIAESNQKNSVEEYKFVCDQLGSELIHPNAEHTLCFRDGTLEIERKQCTFLPQENIDSYIESFRAKYNYSAPIIIDYLRHSGYFGNQILQIIPTDDSFQDIIDEIVVADFRNQTYGTITPDELIVEKAGYRVMQLKVRPESFMHIVENMFPWEDILVGFQVRMYRVPNEYESDFWYHFTNNYIGGHNFRYSPLCGSCNRLNQNPVWINDNWLHEQVNAPVAS